MAAGDNLFYRLLYPRMACLVTSSYEGKENVNAVDWAMPASAKPPAVAIAVNKRGLTSDLISASKEFVLAIPPESMKDIVANCAKTSGRFIDKIPEFGIRTEKAEIVKSPLIANAIAQMECQVLQIIDAGDHEVIIGEVVSVHLGADEEKSPPPILFNKGNKGYFGFQKEWAEGKAAKDEERKEEKNGKAGEKGEEKKTEEKKGEKRPDEKKDEKKADEKKNDDKKSEVK